MVIRFILRLKKSYDFMENSELALMKEYTRGVNDATAKVKSQLSGAMNTISKISHDAIETTKDLSDTFRSSITNEEERWLSKCKLCKKSMDAERRRIKGIADEMRTAMNEFSEVYSKLFKHAAFVDSAHDTILNSTAQIKASKDLLRRIGDEYDDFVYKFAPIMEKTIEDNYVEERNSTNGSRNQQGTKAPNG
jgi:uncharacterized coiled-coil DUF342 family protein